MSGRASWDGLAKWYDEKQGEDGDTWHRTLIDPGLLHRLGKVKGRRILEIGCGNGHIARRLAREGATVVAVDGSPKMIARARRRERGRSTGVTYRVQDAANLDGIEDESFDVVVSNMSLMDIRDGAGAIREAARVLRTGGRFVACLSHPCFDVGPDSAWILERVELRTTVYRKVSRYRELRELKTPWLTPRGVPRSSMSYHRPLSWYLNTLASAGLVVIGFDEPSPTPEFVESGPVGPWVAEIPLHCVIDARKTPG
jgi:ubiquinone/menaquinone biosynthesis C-methylase UbiE